MGLNPWMWQVGSDNQWLALNLVLSTITLYLALKSNRQFYRWVFLVILLALLVYQWQTTRKSSLDALNLQEQALQQMRLREYPPVTIRIAGKQLTPSLAVMWELRKETLIFRNLQQNFAQAVDPNYYFFANHPREVGEVPNLEKFPYIYLPFFLIGVYHLLKRKTQVMVVYFSSVLPITLMTMIGHDNQWGPVALFPFLAVTVALGLQIALHYVIARKIP